MRDELPPVPGLAERWGRSVFHCPYCHGYEFAGQRLGVLYHSAGSAMHAQLIADWGPTTLFLNGDTTLESAERERLQALGITIEPAPIAALEGPGQALQGARLQATGGGDARVVPLDALYVAATTRPASPLAEQLGCAFDDGPMGPYLRTDANKMTTVPGVASDWMRSANVVTDPVRRGRPSVSSAPAPRRSSRSRSSPRRRSPPWWGAASSP